MLGAETSTFSGLAGLGDLVATCVSQHSRNRRVGERLGRGESLQAILDSMEAVAEGVWTTRSVLGYAEKLGIEMPITREVYGVMYEGKSIRDATTALMVRPHGGE
jgi:glycerol-3-phosphate dehydrogenase (NAD(P)+)